VFVWTKQALDIPSPMGQHVAPDIMTSL